MSATRMSGEVARPLAVTPTTGTPERAPEVGTQEVYAPGKGHVQSQKDHGQHCHRIDKAYKKNIDAKFWK